MQEQIGRGLAARDVVGAEDATVEARQEPGRREREPSEQGHGAMIAVAGKGGEPRAFPGYRVAAPAHAHVRFGV